MSLQPRGRRTRGLWMTVGDSGEGDFSGQDRRKCGAHQETSGSKERLNDANVDIDDFWPAADQAEASSGRATCRECVRCARRKQMDAERLRRAQRSQKDARKRPTATWTRCCPILGAEAERRIIEAMIAGYAIRADWRRGQITGQGDAESSLYDALHGAWTADGSSPGLRRSFCGNGIIGLKRSAIVRKSRRGSRAWTRRSRPTRPRFATCSGFCAPYRGEHLSADDDPVG